MFLILNYYFVSHDLFFVWSLTLLYTFNHHETPFERSTAQKQPACTEEM